jgi:type I restriction enzyme R subunit
MLTDMSVLQEPPFTDRGSIVEVFDDLSVWMCIKRVIDNINENAKAS